MNKLKAQVEARLCLKDALRTRLSDPQIQAVNNQTRQKARAAAAQTLRAAARPTTGRRGLANGAVRQPLAQAHRDDRILWMCSGCGHTCGETPPPTCPKCNRGAFEKTAIPSRLAP